MSLNKKFALLFALLFCQMLWASNPTAAPPPSDPALESKCTLPPPAFLNVITVGAGWVSLNWPAVPGASAYRIEVVNLSNGVVVSSTIVSGSTTTAQVSTIGGMGFCQARICTLCPAGGSSWFTHSPIFSTIIIELVVNQLHDHAKTVCNVGLFSPNGCTFPWDASQTPFRIKFQDNLGMMHQRIFTLNASIWSPSPSAVDCNFDPQSGDQSIELVKVYKQNRQCIEAIFKGQTICQLAIDLDAKTRQGRLFKAVSLTNAVIEKVEFIEPPVANFKSQIDERDELAAEQEQATVSPNPFSNELKISLPAYISATKTDIRLLDLMGKVQKTYSISPAETGVLCEISLETADLPTGTYLLQIESGDNVETIRIIKGR